jgi:6-phosphogluconolactonase
MKSLLHRSVCCSVVLALAACGGGGGDGASGVTISGSVSGLTGSGLTLQATSGNTVAVTANGRFQFPDALKPGTPYNVVVQTQPSNPWQTCTVSGGTGTVQGNVDSVQVACSTNAFGISGTVTGLSGSGLVLEGPGGEMLPIKDNGAFAFTTHVTSGDTFEVTVASQPTTTSPARPQTCSVEGGTGAVTNAEVTSVHVACADDPARFAYVLSSESNTVTAFRIEKTTGVLQPVPGSPFATGNQPVAITITPDGKFAYVPNGETGDISAYSIDPASGALTPLAQSPIAAAAPGTPGDHLTPVTIDRSGRIALVADPNGPFVSAMEPQHDNLYAFTIDAVTGALTPMSGSPFATGGNLPQSITLHPTAQVAYIVNFTAMAGSDQYNVSAFALDPAGGSIAPVAGSPFLAQQRNPNGMTVTPDGKFAYVNARDLGFSGFSIGPSGALTRIGSTGGSVFLTGSSRETYAMDPLGRFMIQSGLGDHLVDTLAIDPTTGFLTKVSSLDSGEASNALGWSASGDVAYVSIGPGSIVVCRVDASTGALTPVDGALYPTGGAGNAKFTFDPSGRFLYVTHSVSGTVAVFAVDQDAATLQAVAGSPFTVGGGIGPVVLLD